MIPLASHFKIAQGVDVAPLQQALKDHPELFGRYTQRAHSTSPHIEMTDVWVRYNDIRKCSDMSKFNDEHESVWYPEAQHLPQVKQIAFDLMHYVQGERLGGILITKLPPGGRIHPHVDKGWHAEYYAKFYIPVQNFPGATYNFADGVIEPELGDVWWFDNSVPHWVVNDSSEDRVALIICIKTDAFPSQRHNERHRTDTRIPRDF